MPRLVCLTQNPRCLCAFERFVLATPICPKSAFVRFCFSLEKVQLLIQEAPTVRSVFTSFCVYMRQCKIAYLVQIFGCRVFFFFTSRIHQKNFFLPPTGVRQVKSMSQDSSKSYGNRFSKTKVWIVPPWVPLFPFGFLSVGQLLVKQSSVLKLKNVALQGRQSLAPSPQLGALPSSVWQALSSAHAWRTSVRELRNARHSQKPHEENAGFKSNRYNRDLCQIFSPFMKLLLIKAFTNIFFFLNPTLAPQAEIKPNKSPQMLRRLGSHPI